MRKALLSLGGATIALALLASPHNAEAVTFNFQNLGEGSWNSITGGSLSLGGITVTASASGIAASTPYLDSPDGNGPAGLGVCSFPGSCAGSSDDNVGFSQDNTSLALEHLILNFTSGPVQLTNLTFRNRDHFAFNGSLLINGSSFNVAGGTLALSLSASSF